ncbi:MAG: hypothetical protein PHW64_07720 [Sulfuricurvum sp.]|nr:hypothetical protein [Sulfuricurvum sp.]
MAINLLLNEDSFENNDQSTLEDIYNRIDNLDRIKSMIEGVNVRKKELSLEKDIILKNLAIYDKIIYNELTVSDFIYGDDEIKNDYKVMLRSLIDKSKNLFDDHIEGHICLFNNATCLIFSVDDLINFYYKYFEKLDDGNEFFNRIKIHFPNLHLHENARVSLIEIQDNLIPFAPNIVKTLRYLNDNLKASLEKNKDPRAMLEDLTASISLHASIEGKGKERLNFKFTTTDGNIKTLCCEPHVKYNRSEESGVEKEYYRLYFHTGDKDIEDGKVLIAHIGTHL